MIDLGAAPGHAQISDDIRHKVTHFGSVRLQMNHEFCESLADLIETGLMRHENGVDNPYTFTLH